jgi:predicted methyltransferase
VIRVYNAAGNVIEAHEHAGFKLTANSRIALCGSTNALSISSARTMKRFPSRCASGLQRESILLG